jgi:hypothetical protein
MAPGTASTAPLFHQRTYQLVVCSFFPSVLRLPAVKRCAAEEQKERREAVICWALSPPIVLFFIGFAYILHEEFFKGIAISPPHPSDE